jgi:hypothetical protein
MNRAFLILAFVFVCLAPSMGSSLACEVDIFCENVQAIHVGTGREHLKNGEIRSFYSIMVLVDEAKSGLKEVYANCLQDTIVIRVGGSAFEVLKIATTPAGDWFGIERPISTEALDAAMGMCPDKVKSHLQ